MRVLVTRPKLSAARTAERLISMGHEPVLMPLSEAVHHPQAAAEAFRTPYAALAVTSAEALRAIAATEIRPSIDIEKPFSPSAMRQPQPRVRQASAKSMPEQATERILPT
ncbi:hypothetical protein N7E02_13085 [Aliirhizobium terrae]|uniref:hypothetical protein n=1 Tax=Terrirhizobium terrae TaxID=2926709 RepID=UPI0025775B9C|nr:hypothetical protein [Rhizobium sp. CC-CFT758]WJH41339.1 hypothetical protein N7E02_13085 [Rhizobium sp. CC-CFT758]